jgi:hypothetical protein
MGGDAVIPSPKAKEIDLRYRNERTPYVAQDRGVIQVLLNNVRYRLHSSQLHQSISTRLMR